MISSSRAGMVKVETFTGTPAAVKALLNLWFQDDDHAEWQVVGESTIDTGSGNIAVLIYYTEG